MERPCAWNRYDDRQLADLESLAADYRTFISENKTERECVAASVRLAEARGKALTLFCVGTEPIEAGMDILGAHVDSPRLDVKQNPVYEKADLAFLDTHYYGGLKANLWVATPLAIHGVVAKKDGSVVPVVVGEDPADPVFCISDILIHLAQEQMKKPMAEAVEHEKLDVIVGGRPLVDGSGDDDDAKGEAVKGLLLQILGDRYGIEEEDLLSAELEVVPAGPARDMGFDRSMILGYGHDDRVCAYTSLRAMLDVEAPRRTSTGMDALYFENAVAELMELAGEGGSLRLHRALANSRMLSSDVSAGFDPAYADRFEEKNSAFLGRGLCFNKYTGSRGKSGSNDADAEYVAQVRAIMDGADVAFQTCELGRVNAGGGGTIAYLMAHYGMDVIDSGVAVLSMHSLWEVVSKADVFEAYRGYKAFLECPEA